MHISKLMPSKYLKKEDLDQDVLVTVSGVSIENVARDNEPEENKAVLHFKEYDRGLVCNSTNLQLCAKACGSEDTDDWIGQQVVLYVDDNVSFGGKIVGGLRIRAARRKQPHAPARRAPEPDMADTDDSIPF